MSITIIGGTWYAGPSPTEGDDHNFPALTREERQALDRKEAKAQTLKHLAEALRGYSEGGRLPWRIRLHWLTHPLWVYRSCKHTAEDRDDLEAMGWRELGHTTMEDM